MHLELVPVLDQDHVLEIGIRLVKQFQLESA